MIRLVATLNALNPLFMKALYPYVDGEYFLFTTTLLAGLVSSFVHFPRFQSLKIDEEDKYYTFDWTFLLVTKAIDSVISATVSPHLSPQANDMVDLSVILVSTYCVMTAWWFRPDRLSPQMVNWITKMTRIDPRIQKGVQLLHESTLHRTSVPSDTDEFRTYAASKGKDVKGPIKVGSALAGLSVLFESAKRRNDLMMFVTPKALGTFFEASNTEARRKWETVAFSVSFAVLVAFARSSPARLRGVVGKGLSYMVM
ncbi:hypothetical protein I9W82_004964 [Candida metapsilosis]|uniref:Uncharacterized protein n=1 Tax=Candida metapsilosis TaxID=273372 RepID=A0A8H7ZEF0_9ASCO|nr:hypothetical protein I9W82_004964 [Candida metapsilosis]